ncbi:MAG TPA: hypothetical protein VJO54_15725 [Burkholderiales bacterium]|jgi:hypothetical protein|nr:hypothetical protein [Burkholderiales bacterium]
MLNALSFEAAWRDLDRRSAILWLLLFGGIPGIFFLGYLLNDLLQQDAPILPIVLAWMVGIAWAGGRMAGFACPRCGRAFFENWYFFKPLRRSCAFCSLQRRAKDLPPAPGG